MPMKLKKIEMTQQLMKRWKSFSCSLSLSPRSSSAGGSVRAGHVAVYVGQERRRFVIPTRFLNLPVLASLLEEAEEEFGFQPAGGLALTCDAGFFEWVVDALEKDEDRFRGIGLDAFMKVFSDLAS